MECTIVEYHDTIPCDVIERAVQFYAKYLKISKRVDLLLDFEDGFGNRSWEEEDATAQQAAMEVAKGMKEKTLPPFIGIRIKPFTEEMKERGLRTLDLFLSLTGPVKEVAAMARTSKLRSIDTEDVAAAAVEFANGAIGAIDATTVSFPGQPERIELACTKGTAILSVEELTVHFMDGRVLHEAGSAQGGGGATLPQHPLRLSSSAKHLRPAA